MTITDPGGVFFFTLAIRLTYSASVEVADLETVETLEKCLTGAKKADEGAKQFSVKITTRTVVHILLRN